MNFISTRKKDLQTSLAEAIRLGMPEDGGLYIPEYLPKVNIDALASVSSYSEFAALVLEDFFKGDVLADQLSALCKNAFNFPVPLEKITDNTFMLELFHGPTLSFKDVGARFLAECFNVLSKNKKITILVATSGDTGSAVAAAFYKKDVNVIIFYPAGKISPRQEQQITCWDENILALSVEGNFDDCQRLVKSAFTDPWWHSRFNLSTANSINIGRLLPQITYYAYTSLKFFQEHQAEAGFIVPSGNVGNVTAAYWAKLMGFPIREIVIATNANRVIPDYLESANYQARSSIETLANAMDVGNPSNFERLNYLFDTFESFKENVRAVSVTDKEIEQTIQDFYKEYQKIICPHTATACFVRQQLSDKPWIIVATADPCKFETIIEPLLQQKVAISPQLNAMLTKPSHKLRITNNMDEIKNVIQQRGKNFG